MTTLLSTGYGPALGCRENLEEYWEVMARNLDFPPDPTRFSSTIPYCLWGDEGSVGHSASWMFGTMSFGASKRNSFLFCVSFQENRASGLFHGG